MPHKPRLHKEQIDRLLDGDLVRVMDICAALARAAHPHYSELKGVDCFNGAVSKMMTFSAEFLPGDLEYMARFLSTLPKVTENSTRIEKKLFWRAWAALPDAPAWLPSFRDASPDKPSSENGIDCFCGRLVQIPIKLNSRMRQIIRRLLPDLPPIDAKSSPEEKEAFLVAWEDHKDSPNWVPKIVESDGGAAHALSITEHQSEMIRWAGEGKLQFFEASHIAADVRGSVVQLYVDRFDAEQYLIKQRAMKPTPRTRGIGEVSALILDLMVNKNLKTPAPIWKELCKQASWPDGERPKALTSYDPATNEIRTSDGSVIAAIDIKGRIQTCKKYLN